MVRPWRNAYSSRGIELGISRLPLARLRRRDHELDLPFLAGARRSESPAGRSSRKPRGLAVELEGGFTCQKG